MTDWFNQVLLLFVVRGFFLRGPTGLTLNLPYWARLWGVALLGSL